ncbi:MAG TPA: hypothetical protein VLM38_17835 [Blastocatellia bacterium]|nr:hypothetical protein [Blastocatellia bacterium]
MAALRIYQEHHNAYSREARYQQLDLSFLRFRHHLEMPRALNAFWASSLHARFFADKAAINHEDGGQEAMQHPRRRLGIGLHALERQIKRLDRRLSKLGTVSDRFSRGRGATILFGAISSVIVFRFAGDPYSSILVATLIVGYGVITARHRIVKRSVARHEIWSRIKSVHRARLLLDWQGIPLKPYVTPQPGHPFDTDLDITGPRSLHQFLDTAVTKEGSKRLADWLLNPKPDHRQVLERQALVHELCDLPLFRDKLLLYSAVVSRESGEQWETSALLDWLRRPVPNGSLKPAFVSLLFLSAANLTVYVLSNIGLIPDVWSISFLLYFSGLFIGFYLTRGEMGSFKEAVAMELTLKQFIAAFRRLETYSYKDKPGLARLCAPFLDERSRPSTELKRVQKVASALSLRVNPLLWLVVHALFPWDFYYAMRLNRVKAEVKSELPVWLNAMHELEALSSLANFAYLNPDYIFPSIYEDSRDRLVFRAKALGHPLLPRDRKVCNDFSLNDEIRIAIVTGSNMAGKSTFLRTLGANLCLAYAGAPVNAQRLDTSLFRVFTCIKVSDSVTDGISYFYAEVKRLKGLLEAALDVDGFPLFFLIDEIFRGTNNIERHLGSLAYIRELAKLPVAGAIATHDLELIRLAGEISGIANYHFRDDIHDGRMMFDYRLRSGPCPTTNALKIMQLEGLPVEAKGDPA